MQESNEADIPIQHTEGASVIDLPEADADVTELAAVETAQWSSDIAFLNDSGGLKEWRSFTASRGSSIDATQEHLPKLTLLDDGPASAKTLDSRAIAQGAAVVDNSKLASGAVPELEGGQNVPGEPPRITDPLPPFPPGLRITVPNPQTPGFSVMDPAVPAKPGISADASIPIKSGAPGEPALPVKPGDPGAPIPEVEGGQSVPTEPPKITDPIPKGPPSIQRIVDHGSLTGRKSDTPGAAMCHPNSRDTTPAEQAVTAFKANLRAAESQNQAVQNQKLATQLAAQLELKKLAAQNPERAMKETGAAAALLARKALLRGAQGSDKNSAIKLGGLPKELGKRDPLQTPDGIAAKPAFDREKIALASVLINGFATSILHEKGKHAIASSFPVNSTLLPGARGKQLIAGIKLHDEKVAADKTCLHEPTVIGKPQSPELKAARIAGLSESTTPKPAKADSQAIEFTAPTLSEKSKIFIIAHIPIERSLLRQRAGSELAVAHIPIEPSLLREGAAVEQVAAVQTPVERSRYSNAAGAEAVAAHTSLQRSLLRHAEGAENAVPNMPVARSFGGSAAGREFVVAAVPQDITVTSKARHAPEPSIAIAHLGEPTAANTFKSAVHSLNCTPISDDSSKLLVAVNSTGGKSLLRVATGEKVFGAGSEQPVRATPLTYACRLSEKNSTPLAVGRLLYTELSAAKTAHKIARSLSNGMKTLTLPGDDTIRITSVRSSKSTRLGEKSLVVAGRYETAPALTMSKSLLSSVNSQKSNMETLALAIRHADVAPERETVRKSSISNQKEPGERNVARTASINQHGEIMSGKFAVDLKLRVTYLHIGNKLFLLNRRLVDNGSHEREPYSPPTQLIASVGAAAVIAARRLRRRKKKGAAQDHSGVNINEFDAAEGTVPTTDSVQFNRECVPSARTATRFSYMIQPGDTLSNLAQAIWQDTEVAWLIAEINKVKQEWQGNECSINLVERQVIELPIPEEVVDFYRRGGSTLHKQHKLITIVGHSALDEELSAAALPILFNVPGQVIQL